MLGLAASPKTGAWHRIGAASLLFVVVTIVFLSIATLHSADLQSQLITSSSSSLSLTSLSNTTRCWDSGRPRIALITGISGLIGSHVARALLQSTRSCYKVVGLVRPRSDLQSLVGVLDRIEFVHGDVTDSHRMITILSEIRPDVVFHFAAQAIDAISFSVPSATIDANLHGTLNLFEAIRRWDGHPRVLVAGSSLVYGYHQAVAGPIPETLPLNPETPFAISKAAAEKLASQYAMSFGIAAVTARLFTQIGAGGGDDADDSLALHQVCKETALVELGLAASNVVRHGDPEARHDLTDVRDSAPVLIQLAEDGVHGQAYNVGAGVPVRTGDLLAEVVRQARVPIVLQADPGLLRRSSNDNVLVADTAKIRALTGWRPRTELGATVAAVLSYWRERVLQLYCVNDDCSAAVVAGTARPRCPFADVDLWVPLHEPEFPMLALLINSIRTFMPCFNTLHVVVDRADAPKAFAWVTESDGIDGVGRIRLAPVDFPEALSGIRGQRLDGYIIQAWRMLWADTFSAETGARYVMLLDTDSVFAMPVTCRSIFDSDGRLYSLSWSIERQPHFQQPCIDMTGGPCLRSYMSTFPFTMPINVFGAMRESIRQRLDSNATFDKAFAVWTQHTANWRYFSQFVVMGEYLRLNHPELVRQVYCPIWDDGDASLAAFNASDDARLCLQAVPVTVHLGWGNNGYINGGTGTSYRRQNAGEFVRYSDKYGVATIDAIQAMTLHGLCLRDRWAKMANPLCEGIDTTTLFPDVNLYGNKRTLNWAQIEARFAPDPPGLLCSERASPPPKASL